MKHIRRAAKPIDHRIREQDPLKQGLKPCIDSNPFSDIRIREQDPLKQGLKHSSRVVCFINHHHIREQDPLKQGLKRPPSLIYYNSNNIREQDPLKQGLKHFCFAASIAVKSFVSKIH